MELNTQFRNAFPKSSEMSAYNRVVQARRLFPTVSHKQLAEDVLNMQLTKYRKHIAKAKRNGDLPKEEKPEKMPPKQNPKDVTAPAAPKLNGQDVKGEATITQQKVNGVAPKTENGVSENNNDIKDNELISNGHSDNNYSDNNSSSGNSCVEDSKNSLS